MVIQVKVGHQENVRLTTTPDYQPIHTKPLVTTHLQPRFHATDLCQKQHPPRTKGQVHGVRVWPSGHNAHSSPDSDSNVADHPQYHIYSHLGTLLSLPAFALLPRFRGSFHSRVPGDSIWPHHRVCQSGNS